MLLLLRLSYFCIWTDVIATVLLLLLLMNMLLLFAFTITTLAVVLTTVVIVDVFSAHTAVAVDDAAIGD